MSAVLRSPEPLFGGFTIADMMRALSQMATQEAIGLEQLEIEAARDPAFVRPEWIEDIREISAAVVAARAFLAALTPHGATVHAIIYGPESGT